MEWYVSMSSINRTNSEACIPSHCTMNGTVSEECAVDVVRSITWYRTDHVGGICQQIKAMLFAWLYGFVRYGP